MRRILSPFTAALTFVTLVLTLSLSGPVRTVEASSDIHQRCSDCLQRTQEQYENCQEQFGFHPRCDEQFNRNIVNCYREFCEQ